MRLESVWLATLSPDEHAERASYHRQPVDSTPDVLVIGAGLVGLATAYYLAESGARVQVIDSGSLAGDASGASFGGVWPNELGAWHPPEFQDLAFLGRDLWGRLSVRPEARFDWRVNGFLQVNPARMNPSPTDFAALQQDAGYSLTAVDSDQLRELEPQLSPALSGGVLYSSEASLHPVRAALSLARGAASRGAHLSTGVAAQQIAPPGQPLTIATTFGALNPRFVVLATGQYPAALLSPSASPLPVVPRGGQWIATDPLPPLVRATIGGEFLLLQLKSGEVVTGGNVVDGPLSQPDPVVADQMQTAARALIPALANFPFTRAWCGTRGMTATGLPLIDRAPGRDNVFLAVGHSRAGVLLAPATGKLLAEWITTGQPPATLHACRRPV